MQKNIHQLPLNELRQMWSQAWGKEPHARIGRTMLEKSIRYKINENDGYELTPEQNERLTELIKKYKRCRSDFDEKRILKPGTRLVRVHNSKKHSVLVKVEGFEYLGETYSSLSKIAHQITGKIWNGWTFFGLKKVGSE